ncbi:PadR family transcriptional regulator [Enterobacteriaceae bacterium H11S18]|uniref:PadR family transcriptional regulator n=1 Tax=Dryocola clanedunensis TaxID=2925396 RepID=UPI0022F07368|nr:PadR family transcriptional regulator [Dryocola clanedunensis]MCT4713369.1 PadR family transcriptional regulator [Dryocola clanedunensis]
MFHSIFKDPRGSHHRHHGHCDDRRSECCHEADSREEVLEMMFAQWRRAMRDERMSRHFDPRGEHHHHHHHADRRGGPGGGHRGHFRGGDDAGHRDRPSFLRGRKFAADELQLLLLSLLKDQASYGYELIKILAEKSGGFYTPSPGVIYPALTYMEDVGYVNVQQEGNRKRYAINEQGESYLAENKATADALLAKLEMFARQSDSVSQAMFEHRQPFTPALTTAIHELRSQLHNYHGSSEETQAQVAEIVNQAVSQLRSVK